MEGVWGFCCLTSLSFEILGKGVFALDPCTQNVIPGGNKGHKLVFAPVLAEEVE